MERDHEQNFLITIPGYGKPEKTELDFAKQLIRRIELDFGEGCSVRTLSGQFRYVYDKDQKKVVKEKL